jgi:23S rRNA (cytidine2498-2'-O)-methyltransferase
MTITKPYSTIYVVKPQFIKEACDELGDVAGVIGNLVFSPVKKPDICFAQDVWHDPTLVKFNSISEAAGILRQAGRFWCLNPIANIRRSRLIESKLRKLPPLDRNFPVENEIPDIGCFSLLDENTLVFSVRRWKKWPMGECHFIEDKKHPPNRAYLKLWEALTLLGRHPTRGETAIDLGASPGGWTYVMQSFGTHVTAVDKAELDPRVAKLPNVTFLQQSAFALEPQPRNEKIDWLLSDIACYPDRLYDLVKKWLHANQVKQIIFTIKLQGKTDLSMIKHFQAIPNSRTLHLFYNKHEATFFYPAPSHLFPVF